MELPTEAFEPRAHTTPLAPKAGRATSYEPDLRSTYQNWRHPSGALPAAPRFSSATAKATRQDSPRPVSQSPETGLRLVLLIGRHLGQPLPHATFQPTPERPFPAPAFIITEGC